ncbi:MAG: nitroreductase family protein [Bacteroidales bacterium]
MPMLLRDLVIKNRNYYRRFDESYTIPMQTLEALVDLSRYGASGRNAQPLKYILSNDPASNQLIFPALAWAAYLKDWPAPSEGEQPSAYVVMLLDKNISEQPLCDHGIAAQTILLGAVEKGLGECILMSIKKGIASRGFTYSFVIGHSYGNCFRETGRADSP